MKVWLTISIGSRQKYHDSLNAYNDSMKYIEHEGPKYGILSDGPEQREILLSLNPNLQFEPPIDIYHKIVIDLYNDTPKTTENFVSIIKGFKTKSRKEICYRNTPIHRIVKNFIVQGGDVTRFDGSGGDSIYGGKFKDESAGLKRDFKRGSIGMANSGKNSNTSQFFFVIADSECKKLNGKHVCFGEIVEGIEVLDLINDCCEVKSDQPCEEVFVDNCGVFE